MAKPILIVKIKQALSLELQADMRESVLEGVQHEYHCFIVGDPSQESLVKFEMLNADDLEPAEYNEIINILDNYIKINEDEKQAN